jgi:hypothetical protein
MATQQEELLKALRGRGGREQVNFDLGQMSLRPTIQRGGQYNVQVQEAPRTNPALEVARALKGGSQLLSDFVDVQAKQGEIEANALSPQDVKNLVESGDPNAKSFLDKLGKEKTFVETTYKRYYNSTVQPQLTALQDELKNKPVHEYADQGITTPEDFKAYAEGRVKQLTDKFGEYTSKSPYANTLHNQLLEEVVPKLVQQQTSYFDENVGKFNEEEASKNLIGFTPENGVNLAPNATTQNGTMNKVSNDDARVTIFGYSSDPYKDKASLQGIGANVSPEEAALIKAGKPTSAKMIDGQDFAVSSDIEELFKSQGIKMRDTVTLKTADGKTHTGRWMDRTATDVDGKPLSGRFDIYSPSGNHPLKDSKIAGFTRDASSAEQGFNDQINNIIEVNAANLASKTKLSPTAISKKLRDDSSLQIQTLTKEGKFMEARKLMAALDIAKIGGQPLFGSTEGRFAMASLDDIIDREEEQFTAKNERTSKEKIDNIIAPQLLGFRQDVTAGVNPDDAYTKRVDNIMKDESLTPAEQEKALNRLDTLSSNMAALEFTRARNGDNELTKLQQDGGSALVVKDIASIATQQGAESFISATPELVDLAFKTNIEGKKMLNPAFTTIADGVIGRLLPKYSRLNQDQTQMIQDEQSFDYEVAGKTIRFEGTPDKNAQKDLHMRLANAFRQDFGDAIKNELKKDMQTNPVFNRVQEDQVTSQTQLLRDQEKLLVDAGMMPEEAKKTVLQQSIAEAKGNTLLNTDGSPRVTSNVFESDLQRIERFNNDLTAGRLTDTKVATPLHASVKPVWNLEAPRIAIRAVTGALMDKLKARQELTNGFKTIGIPWDAVQKGFIETEVPESISGFGMFGIGQMTSVTNRKILYPIDYVFNQPNSESTFQILPTFIMRNLDQPEARAAAEKIANDRYDGDYNRLIKGQQEWYSSNNIEISK